jgi:hypothetical protein
VWPIRVWDHRPVESDLETAARAHQEAKRELEARREELAAAIVKAAREGRRPTEIMKITGYTREHVRRILRAAGIKG